MPRSHDHVPNCLFCIVMIIIVIMILDKTDGCSVTGCKVPTLSCSSITLRSAQNGNPPVFHQIRGLEICKLLSPHVSTSKKGF